MTPEEKRIHELRMTLAAVVGMMRRLVKGEAVIHEASDLLERVEAILKKPVRGGEERAG